MEYQPLKKRNLYHSRGNNHSFSSPRRWRCHDKPWRLRAQRIVRGSVRTKFRRLQRLIPGGRGLQPDSLFLRTADYILLLRLQVSVLHALSKLQYRQPRNMCP